MAEKKARAVEVGGCLGGSVGFGLFLVGGMALWSFVGFTVALMFGLPLGWLLGTLAGTTWANRRRAPGTPPAPVLALWLAIGLFVAVMLFVLGPGVLRALGPTR